MRVSVIDHKKFGHRNFMQLILLAQPGLFIYITLILKRIIVDWSNLSTIILLTSQ